MAFPSPVDFGLPPHFTSWRAGQVEALLKATDRPERFVGLVMPTGFGKSMVYMAAAHLGAGTSVILTSTIALQRQLIRDFGVLDGTMRIQGQRAYPCLALMPGGELAATFGRGTAPAGSTAFLTDLTAEHGPCHHNVQCSLKSAGCEYYDAIRQAQRSRIVITNYAWWFASLKNPATMLRPNLLILDEAHAAPDALSDALGGSIGRRDVQEILREELPEAAQRSAGEWIQWATVRQAKLAAMLDGTRPQTRDAMIRIRRAQWLQSALLRLALFDHELTLVSDDADGVTFDLVWAAPYAERLLFRGTPRVVLTSATFSPKTAELLGLSPRDYHFHEAGDGFPRDRRPVYVLDDAPRMRFDLSTADERQWMALIDNIIRRRTDRKGIIHCVSYRRRDVILAKSEFRERMMTHGRHNAADQIKAFKKAKPGTIFVSPSVTTGYDFPYAECEYQIIAKIPFPDTRDPVTAARTLIDREYPTYIATLELVQAVGRGMRAADDHCETFVVDGQAKWFLGHKYAKFSPRWFRRAIVHQDVIPAPPPPLGSRKAAADDETEESSDG